ncbi:MAG TPA: ABC transporter ATP-binding protein [Bryobacterales bacterium]|nr:ABC transporter ATP-binding protein [Bryobacterales bacterium]
MDDTNQGDAPAALDTALDSSLPPSGDAIRIRNLSKRFGDKVALNGLNLAVPRGSFFGFLGPNGAGKTTTIHILTGVLEADSGQVEVLDMPVPRKADLIKQVIGVVPDDSVLFDRLRGLEFLEFVGRIYGLDSRTAIDRGRELMDLFELDVNTTALIAGYSKGMRKRLSLASALIHRPQMFLLDEPFEGVDPVGARLMKDILMRQVERGATVFLTSHVLEVVERLCDRVAIIANGSIVAEGSMAEMHTSEGTLEDLFVRLVGGDKEALHLDWL